MYYRKVDQMVDVMILTLVDTLEETILKHFSQQKLIDLEMRSGGMPIKEKNHGT